MVDVYVRLGSFEDAIVYDSADYAEALETLGPIAIGSPIDADHGARLDTVTSSASGSDRRSYFFSVMVT